MVVACINFLYGLYVVTNRAVLIAVIDIGQ
jgi:hypothetical protein